MTNKLITDDAIACNTLAGQLQLNAFYLRELAPPSAPETIPLAADYAGILGLETAWNDYEASRIELTDVPANAEQFEEWYIALRNTHRKEVAPFFDFLAEDASLPQLSLFVSLEAQVDGRFDDIIALSQLGMDGDMKLALAENYWDEMGLGDVDEMHTRVFTRAAPYFKEQLGDLDLDVHMPISALKNGNLLLMYALRRQHVGRLLGALTLLEQTVPYRFTRMLKGMDRHNVPKEHRYYHDLHVPVDANHGKQLVARVLLPLARQNPRIILDLCEGCLIRYGIEKEYYAGARSVMDRQLH
ncbi:iron-containing redox enzyme family protein [Caballeronia sp. SEWSISQ10-4 2]|uniref:iron-containing redox enzyme family protein n=1 Tax=Caballeronia sp. SEWSISQ10-4 2 TaxID=2937438 RepID=UPI00265514B8|nr:iron-containing redox enzyme family protein [Caballeronia sp. SEWSISQ10-4 2]MDN7177160.1 iron-containing redox enzyme family protein [Caballeronia sp. SEWSISQ10-4 2]